MIIKINNVDLMYVVGQIQIQVKMILTYFASQFPLPSNPNYSWFMNS